MDVHYGGVTWEQYFAAANTGRRQPGERHFGYDLRGGVLWIRAPTFHLQPDTPEVAELEALLEALPKLEGHTQIVFDVRNNGGGDSRVGDRIFEAATGGLAFDESELDRLPRYYAEWRLSEVVTRKLQQWVERDTKLYGADSAQAIEARAFQDQVRAAQAAGETWFRQDAGPYLTRDELARRHAHLARFGGRIVLLTDSYCGSACLDFADLVRQVPGSMHVGRTTGADASYIDSGYAELPSGNLLFLSVKVWRNRLRGNNEPYVPDVALDVDMSNDDAVRRAVLAAIGGGDAAVGSR